MKSFVLILSFLCVVTGITNAQQPVVDRFPTATIYVIDPQSGQEVQAQDDAAIMFKDAFIDLVSNTARAKMMIRTPGRKSFVITQADPADGNAFQLVQQSKFLGQLVTNYTFSYDVDQNTLFYFDVNSQTWLPEVIQGYNVVNLNNCLALGKFNEQQVADDGNGGDVQQGDGTDDDNVVADNPPPPLQDYDQPECPQDGYLWQPGYWAFSPGSGYYWVAGTWVAPPSVGLLWTPPYWGYVGSRYVFHVGYWGNSIGFYGGINYGYGYGGHGYNGGAWNGGHFRYNTAVVNVNRTVVHNTYVDRTVIVNNTTVNNRSSFNGPGGSAAKPTSGELRANNEQHIKDHSQNPRAVSNNSGGNKGQAGARGQGNAGNGQRGAVNGQRGTVNGQRGAVNGQQPNKGPGNSAVNGNRPRVPGNGPPVPKGPGGNRSGSRTGTQGKNTGKPKGGKQDRNGNDKKGQ